MKTSTPFVSGIRSHLTILIISIFIPAAILIIYIGLERRTHSIAHSQARVENYIRFFNSEHEQLMNRAKDLMLTLSHVPAIQNEDPDECNSLMRGLHKENPQYSTMLGFQADGDVYCCALPLKKIYNVSDRYWFKSLIAQNDFVMGEFVISRSAGVATLPLALPVNDKAGNIKSVLSVGLALKSYSQSFSLDQLPADSTIMVVDRNAKIMLRAPEEEKWLGKTLDDYEGISMPEGTEMKHFTITDIDGTKRLYWSARLNVGQETNYVYLLIGVPENTIFAEANQLLFNNLMILFVIALVSLFISWILGGKMILKPIDTLMDAAQQITGGNLQTRTGLSSQSGELGLLGESFDHMASSLEQQEKDTQKAKHELRDSQARYESLFNGSKDCIFTTTINGIFVDINPAMLTMLGYTEDEMLSVNASKIYANAADRDSYQELIEIEGALVDYEIRLQTKDGATKECLLSASLWKSNDGEILGYQGIIRDITEQKQLEGRLQQAQKMEAIGTLAGGIAHDFNNILSAILGYADMAKDDSPKGSPVAQHLDRVLVAGNRAKDLVKQILAFSRQGELECIPLQSASIAKEVVRMLRPSLPTTIEINQDIDSRVGLIYADPTQLHQVLMNLCTNAFHSMEEIGGKLDVSLKEIFLSPEDLLREPSVEPGSFVQISVCDSGTGIAPEIKTKIFDPYFTTKGSGKGTGMGLSIAHGIVKSYGGYISCYSELGQGTAFNVFLPVLAKDVLPDEKAVDEIPVGTENVLFVDDEQLLAEMSKDMLERLGYHVTTRSNSLDALEIFQSQPDQFDVVVTDQTMPDMTGAELAKHILQIRPDIPVILCTGYSSVLSGEKAKAIGIKEFVFKPLVKRDIAVLIRKVLEG